MRDRSSRVGMVVGDAENVAVNGEQVSVAPVEYWSHEQKMPASSLALLDASSPEVLLWERPEELASWAEDAPLKLVAAALSVGGGAGKKADILDKLDGRVPLDSHWERWDKWWGRVLPKVKDSDCFKILEGNEYRLAVSVDDVPEGPRMLPPKPAASRPKGSKLYEELLESQRKEYESRLGQQRRSLESQRTDYEQRLERQRLEQERLRAEYESELRELRMAHKTERLQAQREQNQLRRRVDILRNQLFSGNEQSKLDIRQDMLVIVGELSQLAAKQDCASEDFLRDIRAGLALALQAGDAKTFGAAGEIAVFDPLRHQGRDSLRIGDSVRISAPGVIVKGERTGDRVLVKAQVSSVSEKG